MDGRTLSFDFQRTYASITTQDKRIKIPLVWHRQARRYENWFCKSGEIGIDRYGRWVLWLIFQKEPQCPPGTANQFLARSLEIGRSRKGSKVPVGQLCWALLSLVVKDSGTAAAHDG